MASECSITTVDGKKFRVNASEPEKKDACKAFYKQKMPDEDIE
jgi:hypothetical protein